MYCFKKEKAQDVLLLDLQGIAPPRLLLCFIPSFDQTRGGAEK